MNKITSFLCCCCPERSVPEEDKKMKRKNLSTLESIRQESANTGSAFKNKGTDPTTVDIDKVSKVYEIPKDCNSEPELLAVLGYSVPEFLDSGSFGQVYKARHNTTQLPVAIKKIVIAEGVTKKQKAEREDLIKDVKNELFTLENIYHPHVTKMICHFMIRHSVTNTLSLYIIMQFATNGTLSHYCERNGCLSDDKCQLFFAQILSAMVYMENKGIAHRDLKHSNILLDEAYDCLVSDFGTSRLVLSDAKRSDRKKIIESSTYCGTPPYMAPEVLRLKKKHKTYNAFQSDVWSLGVVLFKMHQNCYPFPKHYRKAIRQMKREVLTFPVKTPSESLKDMFVKIFKYDPHERITKQKLTSHKWIRNTYQEVVDKSTVRIVARLRNKDTKPDEQTKEQTNELQQQ